VRAILIVLAACGGAPKPAPAAPSCDETAMHLLGLANWDTQDHAAPDLAAGIRAQFARDCRDQRWSADRRRCITNAISQEATLDCASR
jgi:hypothetical protein